LRSISSFALLGAVVAAAVFGWHGDGESVRVAGASAGALLAITFKVAHII
jgi:hypothetical protein